MLIPTRRTIVLALAWCALAIPIAIVPGWLWIWEVVGVAWIGAVAADAWLVRRAGQGVTIRRDLSRTLPVGVWHDGALVISAPTRSTQGIVQERVPSSVETAHARQPFQVSHGRTSTLAYRLRPLERGTHLFGPADVRFDSPLRCWHWQQPVGESTAVRVYPDFARIVQYTLLATDHRLSQLGVLRRQRRGQGSEFHQLRDYRQDDSPRQIDWNATARMTRLISREYEDERDQQLVIVLDASQRMRTKDGDLSHFDHALNAVLLLAYVALRQGDSVGVATVGHDRPRFVSPRASLGTVPLLLNALYDLQPSVNVPDYTGVALELRRRLPRRALIVLATAVREEDADGLASATRLLRARHSVVIASLRESALHDAVESPITTFDDALTYAAATDYLERRRRTIVALKRDGVVVLETEPNELARRLVNHYWDRKRAGAA